MKLFFKGRKRANNKGLSLVEVVCAVAIFSVSATAIGGAMVVSAQSYSRGTYELDVQQEAQTTTNLVGNLLVDAVTASFDKTTDPENPVLVINTADVTYTVRFDKATNRLVYTETRTGSATMSGVLAENVNNFDVDLSKFASNKSASVDLKIEKGDRVYEATYNTASRNGSADNVGAVDTASILVETELILEPRQTYELPVSVAGSTPIKTVSVGSLDAADDSNVGGSVVKYENGKIHITIDQNAYGNLVFPIQTNAKDKDNNPLATETVTIKIRKVNSITSPDDGNNDGDEESAALVSGVAYSAGAKYCIDFNINCSNADKAFGKSFDLDYINPKQVDLVVSMEGKPEGKSDAEYFKVTKSVYTDAPHIELELLQNMPDNSKIIVTAKSKHAAGTNKANKGYADVSKTVAIIKKVSYIGLNGEFNRGNDDEGKMLYVNMNGIKMLVPDSVDKNRFIKKLDIYEGYFDESGVLQKSKLVVQTTVSELGGDTTALRPDDSARMKPDMNYVLKVYVQFLDNSNNVVWPVKAEDIAATTLEFPLYAMSAVYEKGGDKNQPLVLKKGQPYNNIEFFCSGLDMTKGGRNRVKWIVQKNNGSGYQPYTPFVERSVANGKTDGNATMNLKFNETGDYRLLTVLENYPYRNYDGSSTSGNFSLNNGSDQGVLYIKVID